MVHPGNRTSDGRDQPHAASLRRDRLASPVIRCHKRLPAVRPSALIRLQRILLLRDLGLGLPQIGEVLARDVDEVVALEAHLRCLREQQDALTRRIASVVSTIEAQRGGENLMAEDMFDGFDHTQHKEEVIQRWGTQAYADSDAWWRGQSVDEQAAWKQQVAELGQSWIAVARAGIDPASAEAQALAARHVGWLKSVPGTPAAVDGGDLKGYVLGLGEMYVSDPRFAKNYAISEGDRSGAEFVRDALRVFAEQRLG